MSAEEILNTANTLFCEGDVVELWYKRIDGNGYETKHVGYFTDFEMMAKKAYMLKDDKYIPAVYVAQNPMKPELLGRAYNQIVHKAPTRSSEGDVVKRTHFFIDIDPKRTSGTSSSNTDHDKSIQLAHKINKAMMDMGWPEGLIGDSGNGAHIVWRCDLENTEDSKNLIDAVLKYIKAEHEDLKRDNLEIQGFADSNRLIKLYETITRKGFEVPELEIYHRVSKILSIPDPWGVVDRDKIKAVADLYHVRYDEQPQNTTKTSTQKTTNNKTFDIIKWLDDNKINTSSPFNKGGRTHYKVECPFNSDHKDATISIGSDGVLGFNCFHDSCSGKHWSDYRRFYEPGYKTKNKPNTPNTPNKYNLTDWGNAMRLIALHGDKIRYCPEMVEWYVWDGKIWKLDKAGYIYQLAKSVSAELWYEAQRIEHFEEKKKLVLYSLQCEGQRKIKDMVESAKNEPGIPISINDFDINRDVVCVGNGIVDLRTSELSGFNRSEYITKQIHTNYNPAAECPTFKKFLNDVFSGDAELIAFMKRFLGYSLTGNTNEQVFIILQGGGGNGKGTLIDTVMDVMEDYAKTTDPDTLIQKKLERTASNDLAALKGARFVATSETESNQVLDEARVKRLTGQDRIPCRFLYREWFDYVPEFTLALSTNHDIIIKSQDFSIWRRILKVFFTAKFDETNCDNRMREKLIVEREGILKWLIEGAKEWYENGLCVPDVVKLTTSEYREDLDVVGDFIDLLCDTVEDARGRVGDLYTVYKAWCGVEDITPKSVKSFGRELTQRNFASVKSNGIRFKVGIDLKVVVKNVLVEAGMRNDPDDPKKPIARALGSFLTRFCKSPYRDDYIHGVSKTLETTPRVATHSEHNDPVVCGDFSADLNIKGVVDSAILMYENVKKEKLNSTNIESFVTMVKSVKPTITKTEIVEYLEHIGRLTPKQKSNGDKSCVGCGSPGQHKSIRTIDRNTDIEEWRCGPCYALYSTGKEVTT